MFLVAWVMVQRDRLVAWVIFQGPLRRQDYTGKVLACRERNRLLLVANPTCPVRDAT